MRAIFLSLVIKAEMEAAICSWEGVRGPRLSGAAASAWTRNQKKEGGVPGDAANEQPQKNSLEKRFRQGKTTLVLHRQHVTVHRPCQTQQSETSTQ